MIVAVLANHILDFLGVVYLITTAVKITRGMSITRWFY